MWTTSHKALKGLLWKHVTANSSKISQNSDFWKRQCVIGLFTVNDSTNTQKRMRVQTKTWTDENNTKTLDIEWTTIFSNISGQMKTCCVHLVWTASKASRTDISAKLGQGVAVRFWAGGQLFFIDRQNVWIDWISLQEKTLKCSKQPVDLPGAQPVKRPMPTGYTCLRPIILNGFDFCPTFLWPNVG